MVEPALLISIGNAPKEARNMVPNVGFIELIGRYRNEDSRSHSGCDTEQSGNSCQKRRAASLFYQN
jgi:hypothetical protein